MFGDAEEWEGFDEENEQWVKEVHAGRGYSNKGICICAEVLCFFSIGPKLRERVERERRLRMRRNVEALGKKDDRWIFVMRSDSPHHRRLSTPASYKRSRHT